MSLWLKWLDRGVQIKVDAPGCGTSVVRGPTQHKLEGFHPVVLLYLKVSSLKVPTSHHEYVTLPHPNQRGHRI